MSKVYVVYEFYDNGESYEYNYTETKVLKIFDSKEKALTFINDYIPNGIMTKEQAIKLAEPSWSAMPENEKVFYANTEDYMWDDLTFIKGIDYLKDTTDGSKYIFVRKGNWGENPEYHIYFKEWEVE